MVLRRILCCLLLLSCNLELEEARVLFNPFPGLRPFEAEDDHVFFGREKEIDDLLRRLRLCRFLAIIGTSGSGKSSLVRAGLVPSLFSGLMVSAGSSPYINWPWHWTQPKYSGLRENWPAQIAS